MNERLKELAKQAGATLEKGYIELSDGQLMLSDNVDLDKSNMDLEKFAELIVRECVETLKKDMELAHIQLIPLDFKMYANGRLQRTIKEHFGVEE